MKPEKIYLYRITHIRNIPHILRYGITHARSIHANPQYHSIGDPCVIDKRKDYEVPVTNGRKHILKKIILGEFIPFYFGVRMPMLYVIQHGLNCVSRPVSPSEIVYLGLSLKHILKNGREFYFSDGHALDKFTTFYNAEKVNELPSIIDWKAVNSKWWADDVELKRKKQAEFLLKGDVPPAWISGFACFDATVKEKLLSFGIKDEKIKIFPGGYF